MKTFVITLVNGDEFEVQAEEWYRGGYPPHYEFHAGGGVVAEFDDVRSFKVKAESNDE
jgi:hypothetical protein